VGEAYDGNAVDPGPLQGLELLFLRHEQRRRLVRTDDTRRVRIEGQHERRAAALERDASDPLDDLHMTAVEAVEIAQRQHGIGPTRRAGVGGKPGDIHQE
jgi:hypothetical protein